MKCVCDICLGYLIKPSVCENGHAVCTNCTARIDTCPFCRSTRLRIDATLRRRLKALTSVKCLHSGCAVVGRLLAMDHHLRRCEYGMNNCPKMGCRWRDRYALLAQHVVETHSDAIKSKHDMQHDEYFTYIDEYLVHVEAIKAVRDRYAFRFRCANDIDFVAKRVVAMCLDDSAHASNRFAEYLEVTVDQYEYDHCFVENRKLRMCWCSLRCARIFLQFARTSSFVFSCMRACACEWFVFFFIYRNLYYIITFIYLFCKMFIVFVTNII